MAKKYRIKFQVLMLSNGPNNRRLVGYDVGDEFILYEKKYQRPGKWSETIIARFTDYQRMLYIAGDIAKRHSYYEEDGWRKE